MNRFRAPHLAVTKRDAGIAFLMAVVVTLTQAPSISVGHVEFGSTTDKGLLTYDKGGCRGDKRADPINIIFKGDYATAGNSAVHLKHHGVSTTGGGSDDFVRSHGECYPAQAQTKSDYHFRLFDNYDTESNPGARPFYTAAPGHHERVARCTTRSGVNDVVYENDPDWRGRSGFDAAAAEAVSLMQGVDTHRVVRVDKVPHKGSFSNCLGEKPDWNGRIVWISI